MNSKQKQIKAIQKALEIKQYQRYIGDKKYVVEAGSLEEANTKFEELEKELADLKNNDNN